MKINLILAALLTLAISSAAMAATTDSVTMTGTVTNDCTMTVGAAPTATEVASMLSSNGVQGASFSLGITCSAGGMIINVKSANGGFKPTNTVQNVQSYSATLTAPSGLSNSEALTYPNTTDQQMTTMNAATVAGTVTIKVSNFSGIPDTYSDTLTFSLTAQ